MKPQPNRPNRANYFSKTPYRTFCKVFFAKSFAGIINVEIWKQHDENNQIDQIGEIGQTISQKHINYRTFCKVFFANSFAGIQNIEFGNTTTAQI
jgi:hypothetical protein